MLGPLLELGAQLIEPPVEICGPRHFEIELGTGDRMFERERCAVKCLSGGIALVRGDDSLPIAAVDRVAAEKISGFR